MGGWMGRRTDAEKLAPPGFDPWTVQPVSSSYTDWAILALVWLAIIHIYWRIYVFFIIVCLTTKEIFIFSGHKLKFLSHLPGSRQNPDPLDIGDFLCDAKRPECEAKSHLHLIQSWRMAGARPSLLLLPSCLVRSQLYGRLDQYIERSTWNGKTTIHLMLQESCGEEGLRHHLIHYNGK